MTEVLAGIAAAVWVYPTLRRWAVWRWLAALATVPALASPLLLDAGLGSAALAAAMGGAGFVLCFHGSPSRSSIGAAVGLTLVGVLLWMLNGGDENAATLDPGSVTVLLLVVVPVALASSAAAGLGRAAGSQMRWPCLLATAIVGLSLGIAGGDALTALAWGPAAAALGLTAILRGRRGASATAPQTDEVDEQVLAAFAAEHPELRFSPVVVVVAAYNEAAGVPGVITSLPRSVCELDADVLVVDDGSSDGTADAARSAGRAAGRAYVAACPTNRGQGRALRLGYRLAREHGAAFVVTTDADGQYSPDEVATVLAPVVDGRADFVTGSRRLGVLENRDAVRQAGTYVFAWLATVLLGRRLTDTSFGLRAMRAQVTGAVTLNQPQYQASELLVGVVSHGFRVLEVPGTLRVRSAGSSKKGGNLVYGARYARVLIGTWWREGCPRPVAEAAPALQGSTRHVHEAAHDVRV